MLKEDQVDEGKLNKLEKEMDQMNKNKDIEELESELIKKYEMKEGDYKVIITIYESQELEPHPAKLFNLINMKKTACDAYVEIEVRDQKKRTQTKKQTNNPIFDENFYFSFDAMSVNELDTSKISFNVYDKNYFFSANTHVGHFELDWTNIYFKRNHEIYKGWLTLTDPEQIIEQPVGYLLVNIAVLGPDDQITIHDSAYIKDPLSTVEDTIKSPKLTFLIDYTINVEVYRAQNLIPLDLSNRGIDGYVVAKFSGARSKTSVLGGSNPEWNQLLKLGTTLPTKTKYIMLEVWNYYTFLKHQLIGVIKIPLSSVIEDKDPKARWGHLYGPPMAGKDIEPFNYASEMQIYGEEIGSHYRGRILYKIIGKRYIHSKTEMSKLVFSFPLRPTPVIPLKAYNLSIDLIEGFKMPIRQKSIIQVAMGQYLIKSKKEYQNKQYLIEFLDSLETKTVQFPEDVTQLPDIIIYFCNGLMEKDRMSYVRIKAAPFVTSKKRLETDIYALKSDKSLAILESDELGGYITARINLYTVYQPQSENKNEIQKQYEAKENYMLKIFLYKAEGLPPANETGDVDAMMRFDCYGNNVKTEVDRSKDQTLQKKVTSYNPFWGVTLDLKTKMQADVFERQITKGIVCEMLDDEGEDQKPNFIGSFLVKINKTKNLKKYRTKTATYQFLYIKPTWYSIIDHNITIGNNIFGKVLVAFSLFKMSDYEKMLQSSPEPFPRQLITYETKKVHIYLIGLRGLVNNKKKSISNNKMVITLFLSEKATNIIEVGEVKNSGAQINKLLDFPYLELPKNKNLLPFMQVKLEQTSKSYNDWAYGFNSVNLYTLMPDLKESDEELILLRDQHKNQIDSEDTLLDVDTLEKQIELIKQRKKQRQGKLVLQNDKIENLPLDQYVPPAEIAGNGGIISEEVLNTQLLKLNQAIKNDPQYDYVRNLEKFHDREREDAVKDDMEQNLLDTFNPIALEEKLEPENQQTDNLIIRKVGNRDTKVFNIDDKFQKEIPFKKYNKTDNQMKGHQSYLLEKQNQSEKAIRQVKFQQTDIAKKSQNAINPSSNGAIEEERNRKSQQYLAVNSEREIQKSGRDLQNRYSVIAKNRDQQNSFVERFDVRTEDKFSEREVKENAIRYNQIENALKQQQADEKEAREKEAEYKFAQAVKLSLFSWRKDKPYTFIETYEDYDTDQGENLDITPEWYKGRKILASDFQDIISKQSKNKIKTIEIFVGKKSDNKKIESRVKESVGCLKLIMVNALGMTPEDLKKKSEYYSQLLKPKTFFCRIYILKGKSLISSTPEKPTTFLRITYNEKVFDLEKETTQKEENNPEYYRCQEIQMNLPGSCIVRIEVIEKSFISNRVLGFTQIDLEDRYYQKKWHLYEKKPIELRNLYSDNGHGTQGRLETFIDLIEKKNRFSNPVHKIAPPPFNDYELRIIVWSTDDCVFKNTVLESNDVFVRGRIGKVEDQQTDTHWACRSTGNFNYRFKFPVKYPAKPEDNYSDVFIVQIWNRDIIGYNELIGQTRIYLNQMHRIIQKVVVRKKSVKASKKIKEKNFISTDKFWFQVTNHKEKDEFGQLQPQGRVQLSFELVPKEAAENQKENGFGRSSPNVYPTLPDPAGRLNFDFLHPLDFLKQLIGPNLYASICCKLICIILLLVFIFLFFYFFGSFIAVKAAGI